MSELTINKSKSAVSSTFALPNKKVRLVPIVRRESFMNNTNHDGLFLFTGCSHSFVVPYSSRMKRLIDPLSDEEREYLTERLQLNLDANSKNCFYRTHRIEVKKVSTDLKSLFMEFDLSNPMDYLDYKILLTVPVISPTWAEKDTNPEYEWALQDLGEEFEQKVTLGELKQNAYVWLSKSNQSKSKMYDMLRVYGVNVSSLASLDELKSMLIDIIETPKTVRKLIELIKDKDFEHKLFLDKCIRIGEIIRIGTTKYQLLGGDIIGNTIKEAIEFIKDKRNSVVVASLQDKIELNKL